MTGLERLYDYAERERILIGFAPITFAPALTIRDRDESKGDYFYIALDPWQVNGENTEKRLILHELSHIAVGAFYKNEHDIHYMRKMENKALRWQIEQEISNEELMRAVALGYSEAWQLAAHFDVPEDFMQKVIFYYANGRL